MVIPEVVRNGFLTEARLKKYLEADCTVLEQRDPDEGLTLLGAATVAGHADKVLLLLKRGAEADTLSKMAKHSWLPRKDRQELPQQVIYCDDCGSMKGEDSWKSQTNLVERITKITTRVFPQGEGVVLRFINQEVDGSSNLSLEHVAKILTPMKWDDYGNTTIDIKLRSRILRPFIYDKLDSVPKKLERPLLISILTDGGPEPKPGDTVKNAIVECGQSLKDAAFPREVFVTATESDNGIMHARPSGPGQGLVWGKSAQVTIGLSTNPHLPPSRDTSTTKRIRFWLSTPGIVQPGSHVYIDASLPLPNFSSPSSTKQISKLQPDISDLSPYAILILIFVLVLTMAFQMPSFLSRFLRPLSSAASMSLQPDALAAMQFPPNSQRAIFAGGCFWGLEELYRHTFGDGKGLLDCRVGYTGGQTKAPTYADVCSGRTGHAESLLIVFDPDRLSYRQLCEFFFRMHDPTTLNRQGADTGTQYRSAIFAENDDQLKIAEETKQKVGEQWYKGKPITTEIRRATQWYDAEAYHQKYLIPEPGKDAEGLYHCPAHYRRPFPELK